MGLLKVFLAVYKPGHVSIQMNKLFMMLHEIPSSVPKRGKRSSIIQYGHVETIDQIVVPHEFKDVILDLTCVLDLTSGVVSAEETIS